MKFDDEPLVPGHPLPLRPGHSSPGRLERVLRAGAFAVTAEISPPDSADPNEVYERASLFDGYVDAIGQIANEETKSLRSAIGELEITLTRRIESEKLANNAAIEAIDVTWELPAPFDQRTIDDLIDRPLEQLDPIELSVLLIGVYELESRIDVPYKVVINEGVNLAKRFGSTDGHKYINACLDVAAKSLREVEVQASSSG